MELNQPKMKRKAAIKWKLRELVSNEHGGVHILLFCLMGMIAIALIWVTAINWMMQTYNMNKTKPLIDHATKAAALNIDRSEAALGRLVWDSAAGTDTFYTYLRLNLKLDASLKPISGSHLTEAPTVRLLEFVTNPTYPYVLYRSVQINPGVSNEVTRNIDVTIYGPSVVAVVEVSQQPFGGGQKEPILLSSVANVRLR